MASAGADPNDIVLNLLGEKVALGPYRRDLLPLYQRWDNNFAILTLEAEILYPSTRESTERWYQQVCTGGEGGWTSFTIYERTTTRPIGRTALHHVDHANGTGEFSIAIGETDCWGKGFGSEATQLVLDYGFTGLGLHNIMLIVLDFNERAIRAYKRAGFREISRRREAHRIGSRAFDVIYMECLASEFRSPVLAKILPDG